jgi:hypothetical protein
MENIDPDFKVNKINIIINTLFKNREIGLVTYLEFNKIKYCIIINNNRK